MPHSVTDSLAVVTDHVHREHLGTGRSQQQSTQLAVIERHYEQQQQQVDSEPSSASTTQVLNNSTQCTVCDATFASDTQLIAHRLDAHCKVRHGDTCRHCHVRFVSVSGKKLQ